MPFSPFLGWLLLSSLPRGGLHTIGDCVEMGGDVPLPWRKKVGKRSFLGVVGNPMLPSLVIHRYIKRII